MVSALAFIVLLVSYLLIFVTLIEVTRRNKRLVKTMMTQNEINAELLTSLEWAHDTIARMRKQERDI